MTDTPSLAMESDAVSAFIRQNQACVLRESTARLEASSLEDLSGTVHAIHGSLGSYQLHSAHEHIAALATLLADPTTSPAALRMAQLETVALLRSEAPAYEPGSERAE